MIDKVFTCSYDNRLKHKKSIEVNPDHIVWFGCRFVLLVCLFVCIRIVHASDTLTDRKVGREKKRIDSQ